MRGMGFIAGTRKCLKVEYLGGIEYDFQKFCVTGPWDHKVSVSAKKSKQFFHACVPLNIINKIMLPFFLLCHHNACTRICMYRKMYGRRRFIPTWCCQACPISFLVPRVRMRLLKVWSTSNKCTEISCKALHTAWYSTYMYSMNKQTVYFCNL
jgi:hypothetical protein